MSYHVNSAGPFYFSELHLAEAVHLTSHKAYRALHSLVLKFQTSCPTVEGVWNGALVRGMIVAWT